jgi:hypothetical protein
VAAGISFPMITFSFRPSRRSTLPSIEAIGQHLRRLLEGGCGEEGLGGERRLRDPEDQRLERRLVALLLLHPLVLALEHDLVDHLAGQEVGRPEFSIRTFFSICRTISSMCLSWMSTPCDL